MKKLILWGILATSLLLLVSETTNAISYQGSAIRLYPDNYNDRLRFHVNNYILDPSCFTISYSANWRTPMYCSVDYGMKRATIGNFVEIEPQTYTASGYTLISNQLTFGEWYSSFGTQLFALKNSSGSYDLTVSVTDQNGDFLVVAPIGVLDPNDSFSSGSLPNRFVLYMSSEYSEIINTSTNQYSYYLREVNFCLYVNSVASNVCFTKNYINTSFPNGILVHSQIGTNGNLRNDSRSPITGVLYTFDYSSKVGQYNIAGQKQQMLDFITGTGAGTMTNWLGGTSSYYVFGGNGAGVTPPTGTGSTGTGYYSDCGSLDVGCYISGTASRFGDAWIEAKDNTIAWLFPTINFNGMSDTCLTTLSVSGDTLSGSTISASGATTGMIQKVVNLFGILLPVAPVDGSSVCLIDGTVKTIDYDNRTNVLDIIIVLTVFFSAFISIGHSKPHA